jgi:type II secretory pathway pseudopilin PulG
MQHPPPGRPALSSPGFSLVAVVIAVSFLGMVSAFAVPRFTRLAAVARASEVVALSANLRHTAQAAHAQFLAGGAHLSASTIEGKSIHLENGYPDTGPGGIRKAVFESDDFTAQEGAGVITFTRVGAPAAQQCAVTYRGAPDMGAAPPVTDIDVSGC